LISLSSNSELDGIAGGEHVAEGLRQRSSSSSAAIAVAAIVSPRFPHDRLQPEMWNLLAEPLGDEALGAEVHELVDMWHLLEKLGRAAAVIHGSGSAGEVVRGWRLRLLNSSRAAEGILDDLKQSGREHVQVGESRPVHDAITYIENNGNRMDYASARRRGLPVGSGNVEATCKSLVEVRMKRPAVRDGRRTAASTSSNCVPLLSATDGTPRWISRCGRCGRRCGRRDQHENQTR
jgi:hypothetical protein